jgi:hypothetical protein
MANESDLDIINAALSLLGETQIAALTDGSDASRHAAALYEPCILSLFSGYEWGFAKERIALEIDGGKTPVNQWRYAFLMPTPKTEMVGRPLAIFNTTAINARKMTRYEIESRWVMTNESTIVIQYVKRQPVELWPGYFERLAIEAVAAILAMPVTEIAAKQTLHQQNAFGSPSENMRGGLFGAAMTADTQASGEEGLFDDADQIDEARFGGAF